MHKKVSNICLLIVLVLLLSAFGCSNGSGKVKEDLTEAAEEQITLQVAIHVANPKGQEPAFYEIVNAFQEEYPDIHIELDGSEQKAHVKKIKMMAQSGSLPDVFWILPSSARELESTGLLLDLQPFLESHSHIAEKLHPNMLDTYNQAGKQFGLPYQSLVTGFWYNKALFKKYQVELPETYEGLKHAVQIFNTNDVVSIAKGSNDPYSVWSFLTMFSRYGYFEKIDSILNGNESYHNEDFLNFYNKIAELRELGAFPPNVSNMSYFQAVQMFINGEAAMLDAGIWEAKKLQDSPIAEDVGFWWGPTFDDGVGNQKISSIVPAAPLVVNQKLQEDEDKYKAVMKFLEFYYSQDGATIMMDNQVLPVVKYEGGTEDLQPVFSEVYNAINDSAWVSQPNQADLIVSEGIANAIYDSIYGVINGIYTPEEAIREVQEKIEAQ